MQQRNRQSRAEDQALAELNAAIEAFKAAGVSVQAALTQWHSVATRRARYRHDVEAAGHLTRDALARAAQRAR